MKVAIATDIDTFNPFLAILASSTGILRFQYENLVQCGVNNEPVPGLSDTWGTSTDGTTWTYHIRDGTKWSDNQPLTAHDVAWTFTAVKTNAALQKANGGLVENVQTVMAKDPSTLQLPRFHAASCPSHRPRAIEISDLCTELLAPLGVPVAWELGFGHGLGSQSVPLGVPATLTVQPGGVALTVDAEAAA